MKAEDLYASQLRGLRATADLDIARPLLDARREALIQKAIMDHRVGKLTELGSMLLVAALSENLQLRDDLEHIERQGQRAGKQLQS